MAAERFTRARLASVTYGTPYTLEYTIPSNKEFKVFELFASSTKNVIVELQFSDDGGTTWSNPWDSGSQHLLWMLLGAGIPASGKVSYTWFQGDGVNTKVRITITNTEVDAATTFYLIKALERTLS